MRLRPESILNQSDLAVSAGAKRDLKGGARAQYLSGRWPQPSSGTALPSASVHSNQFIATGSGAVVQGRLDVLAELCPFHEGSAPSDFG